MIRTTLFFVVCVAFVSSALGQSSIGTWSFQVEDTDTSREKRIAYTSALSDDDGVVPAMLEIRRLQAKAPMDLVVTVHPGVDETNCEYGEWELTIDAKVIPVKSFSIAPVSAILVPGKDLDENQFWKPFIKGNSLMIRAGRKCEGIFGKQEFETYTFSLYGSAAAHKFVLDNSKR